MSFPNTPAPDRRQASQPNGDHFRLLVESVRDYGIFLLDPEGRIASWNAGAERIKGYHEKEIVGEHFSVFYTPEDVAREYPAHELEVAAREGRFEDEGWRLRKDGSRFWANVVITALHDAGGELVGFAKVTRDLTARKHATDELQRREERFRSLVRATAQMVWVTDPEGMLLADQSDWGAFTGQSSEEYRGWGWLEAVHPEDRTRTADVWKAAVESRSVYRVEHRVRRHDGEYRIFDVRGIPVLESDGSIREWVGTHTDVTDRRRAQEERDFLAEASRTFASTLDYETTLRDVAHLAVPAHADFCLVDLMGVDGEIRRVATAHRDPQKEELYRETQRRYPPVPERSPLARVLRTGEPFLLPELTEEWLDAIAHNDEHRRLIRDELGTRSLITVPLSARGQTLGVITFGSTSDSGRRYGPADLELAEELARRAAVAVDNACLFREAEEARVSLEQQTIELELQVEEVQNQAAQLEENQLELEMANDDLQLVNAELGVAEAHYRRLVETSPYGVFVLDAEGGFREMNAAGARILGRSAEETIERHFSEMVVPDDLEVAGDAFVRVISGRDTHLELELWVLRPSGERRLVNVVITGISDNGEITGIHGVSRDITEERRTQDSLRESEARHRTLLQAIPDLIFRHTREGELLDFQAPEGTRDLYVSPEQIRGRHVRDLLAKEVAEAILTHTQLALGSGDVQRFEYELTMSQGTQSFEARMVPNSADEVLVLVRNITEQKRSREREEELFREQAVRAQAEAANQAKNEFLSRMSHELRTPLNAILGFGQLLEMDLRGEADQESVEQILRAGKHLLHLVDEVLDIARIEAGQMSISVEPVSVRSVLQESVGLVRLTASNQGIALRTQNAWASEYFVQADQQRLKQVLLNLLSNAVKYNRSEGTITLSCEEVGEDRLRIVVRDTGYGIPSEKLERLFTPFDRLDAEQRGVEGTGLGLALSKGITEAMGGRLGVDSVEGEGSRFWVELPLAAQPEVAEPARDQGRADAPAEAGMGGHTVLFVEDNLANVRLMERIFQRKPGVRLLTAMQGSLGLELAREHRPDLILLDLNLPDLPGDKVLLQLRQDPILRETPVVMISGDAIPSQVQRMLDMGAQAYVTKPFQVQELLDLLDENLQRRER